MSTGGLAQHGMSPCIKQLLWRLKRTKPNDWVSIVQQSPVDEVGHGERLQVLAGAEDRLQRVGAVVIVANRRPVLEENGGNFKSRTVLRLFTFRNLALYNSCCLLLGTGSNQALMIVEVQFKLVNSISS